MNGGIRPFSGEVNGTPSHIEYPDWQHDHGNSVGLVLDREIAPEELPRFFGDEGLDRIRELIRPHLYVRGRVNLDGLPDAKKLFGDANFSSQPSHLPLEVRLAPNSRNNHLHTHPYRDPAKAYVGWICTAEQRGPTIISDFRNGESAIRKHYSSIQGLLGRDSEIFDGSDRWTAHEFIHLAIKLGDLENTSHHSLGEEALRISQLITDYRLATFQSLGQKHLQRWVKGDFLILWQGGSVHACYTPEVTKRNSKGLWYHSFSERS